MLDSELLTRHGMTDAPGLTRSGVVVTVKRRRAVAAVVDLDNGSQGGPSEANRAPRVFQVGPLDSDLGATDHEGDPVQDAGMTGPSGTANTASPAGVPRRRRVTDPSRAPGKVTTVMFAAPAVEQKPMLESTESAIAGSFVVNVDRYSRALAELEAVRATVQLAMRARGFRIL